jgi:hypothetical protein
MKFDCLVQKILKEESLNYRGEHQSPDRESGAPGYDLTLNGIYPQDVYTNPQWYETEEGLQELRKVLSWKGNPEYKTFIYRAIPISLYNDKMKEAKRENSSFLNKVIHPGDWVTTNKKYAQDHGEGTLQGKYKVVGLYTKIKNIFTNGDSIMEWGYHP